MTPILDVGWLDAAIATGLLVVTVLVSLAVRLGLHRDLLVGMLRTVVQLTAAGFVLKAVFEWDSWLLVVLAMLVMLLVAAWTALRRVTARIPGTFQATLLALSAGALATFLVVAYGIVGVDPWYAPRYTVPLFGLILGNSMTGVALGLDRLHAEITRRREEIEALLALGATSYQASREAIRESLKAAMIPTVNSLMVVGIVFLPGLMTGQLLAGVEPVLAMRYQIVVMFMVAFAVTTSSLLALFTVYRRFFTSAHQLRIEPLARRSAVPRTKHLEG